MRLQSRRAGYVPAYVTMHLKRNLLLAAALIGGVVLFGLGFLAGTQAEPRSARPQTMTLPQCIETYITRIKPDPVDINVMKGYGSACNDLIRNQNGADMAVATAAVYTNQRYNTNVLLWMVVAITLSGVALAALQLLGSYRLAAAGHGQFSDGAGGDVTLSATSVAVKSSVVGVVILGISLAFFIVFVGYVYPITGEGLGGGSKPFPGISAPLGGQVGETMTVPSSGSPTK
jgi:hypothetical protein